VTARAGRAGRAIADRATVWGYTAGWRVVRTLPEPAATALFDTGAGYAWRRQGPGTRRLAANLRRVLEHTRGRPVTDAELEAATRAGLRSYARYWQEAFRLPSWPRKRILDFQLDRADLLADAYAAGRGVIVALSHAGNWDHAGGWACLTGYRLSTVAERLRPEALYRRFLAYRESLGMEIVPLTGGSRPPIDELADRVRDGHLVVLLADRDLSARGVPVTFFGAPTKMPAGPALLALRTGAPLLVMNGWYEPGLTRGRMHGPLELPTDGTASERAAAVTQRIADVLAEGIAEHPTDWHMLQRLWLDQPKTSPAAAEPAREIGA
jgi:lauroyl/myristoyl acyltransferase